MSVKFLWRSELSPLPGVLCSEAISPKDNFNWRKKRKGKGHIEEHIAVIIAYMRVSFESQQINYVQCYAMIPFSMEENHIGA